MKDHLKAGWKALLVTAVLPVVAVLFSAAVSSSAGGEDLTLLRLDSSRFVFLQTCSQCHEPERGYLVIDNPEEWAATVTRMLVKDGGHITLEKVNQFALIMKYGTEYKRNQKVFFEDKALLQLIYRV